MLYFSVVSPRYLPSTCKKFWYDRQTSDCVKMKSVRHDADQTISKKNVND